MVIVKNDTVVKAIVYMSSATLLDVVEPSAKLPHILKLRSGTSSWFLICFKSKDKKDEWIDAFLEERKIAHDTMLSGQNPTAKLSAGSYSKSRQRKESGLKVKK